GKPIAGVSVHVQAESSNRQELKAGQAVVYRGLSEEDSIETDEHGNWSIDNAPPAGKDEYTFSTRLVHPDYISDDNWGETQQRSDVTQEQLRDLNAVFRMAKGAPIKGRVTLPDGKPAITGVVIWHPRPYFTPGSQECQIEADGTFTTTALPEGEHPLTVVVPGYSPWFQQVRVYPDMGPLDVQLEPGHPLTIRIQDAEGKPIPQAYISIEGWHQVESLYNAKHSNVLSTEIPYRGDNEGVFRWTWAPQDGVKYRISASGYSYREVVLSASPKEHVITLSKPLRISGTVTDKITRLPIETFDVIPVHVFRPDWLDAFYPNAAVGRDGKYLLDDQVRQTDRPYRVRIQADGYRTAMSAVDIDVTAGIVEVDFQLEPSEPLVGNVVLPDGGPAVGADVQFATPTLVPDVSNNSSDGSRLVSARTDDQGRFTWRAQFEPLLIHVIHKQGFAERELGVDEQPGTIQLQPWASIRGRLIQSGKPVANERIEFWPQKRRTSDQPRFEEQYYAITDADGRFEFERLPPIAGSVRAYLGPWQDSPLQSSQSVPVALRPGEQLDIELGGSGTHITGQVVPTGRGGAELDEGYSLNYLIARRPGIPVPPELLAPEFDIQHPLDERSLSTLSGNPWLHSKDNYFVKLSPEGDLNVHGVPAGEYDLVIQLFEKPAGCLVESIGQRVIPVIVSQSDVASGTLKLGRIEVPCRVGPRIGSDMDLYAFTDATGRGTAIAQERGKHVVLQFWATWCGPCIESMKNIEPRIDRLNHDNLVIAAINIDSDPREAKRFAIANRFTWANDFVGAKSKIAQQLAISTLPAYFLIDGEGKLAATAVKWEDIEKELKRRELVD
ncbi:MAG: redoxin family protein, partial [Aureliella sp.]